MAINNTEDYDASDIRQCSRNLSRFLPYLKCPQTGVDLSLTKDELIAHTESLGSYQYEIRAGIPRLFSETRRSQTKKDVTLTMKRFYESAPFPNYDEIDSKNRLRLKAKESIVFDLLDQQIPERASILEIGCGTGQLANYFSLNSARTVIGTDLSMNSLRLAECFRSRNSIQNCLFVQSNLFQNPFQQESFDIVMANGVLHHTADAKLAFQCIAKLVKPGGFLIVGLYNRYGRLPTDLRRMLFSVTGGRLQFLDPHLRGKRIGKIKKTIWFLDQYRNPHESKHSYGEVMSWLSDIDFEFTCSIPPATAFDRILPDEALFTPHPRGNIVDHGLVQLGMIFNESKEGALFIVIGQRN